MVNFTARENYLGAGGGLYLTHFTMYIYGPLDFKYLTDLSSVAHLN